MLYFQRSSSESFVSLKCVLQFLSLNFLSVFFYKQETKGMRETFLKMHAAECNHLSSMVFPINFLLSPRGRKLKRYCKSCGKSTPLILKDKPRRRFDRMVTDIFGRKEMVFSLSYHSYFSSCCISTVFVVLSLSLLYRYRFLEPFATL